MCYDVAYTAKASELSTWVPELIFDEDVELLLDGTHIIGHDYREHPIIYRSRQDQKLHCRLMEWGCIPYYIKNEQAYIRQRAGMLNARSERILEDKTSYWYEIRNRRCLIPVTGFYDHRGIKGWKKKVPYHIKLKEQELFFIAGLYSVVELPDTETGEMIKRWTYTLITRPANDIMRNIHNDGENKWRMPLMLPFEMSMEWLDNELSIDRYKEILSFEMPDAELNYWPVWTIRTSKDRPDCKAKNVYFEWEKLPQLGEANPD